MFLKLDGKRKARRIRKKIEERKEERRVMHYDSTEHNFYKLIAKNYFKIRILENIFAL